MRTISRHRPSRSPPGDTRKLCSYCGAAWYRSQLRRDAAGLLACPDEYPGRDAVTLSEGNAALAGQRTLSGAYGESDGTTDSKNTTPAPPFSWNGFPASKPNGGPTGPLSVPVAAWWRADVVQLVGTTTIEGWPDQSGSGNSLGAIGTSLPVLSTQSFVGGNAGNTPLVGFNGSAARMYTPLRVSAPLWAWFIIRQNSWVGGSVFFNCGCTMTQQNASPILRMQSTGADNNGAPIGSWVRGVGSFTVAGTDDLLLGATPVSSAGLGLRQGSTFVLGANSAAGTAPMGFSLADFVLTIGAPTAAEQAAMDAYGQARYGTTTVAF